MVWGIIAALKEELALILNEMDTQRRVSVCGMDFHVGTVDKTPVVAVCCSVGTVNAAICATIIIREFGAQAVVNIGVAGSACDELSVFDVVLGNEVIYHDVQSGFLADFFPYRHRFSASGELIRLAEASIAAMGERDFRYKTGRIATGDVFVDNAELKADIIRRCEPLCVEMEGAAIGHAAYVAGIPFIVIRSLSDNAEEHAVVSFRDFVARAARNSAGIVLGMIRADAQSNPCPDA